jgi:hypothetical protein
MAAGFFVFGTQHLTTEVSSLAPQSGESQVQHYQRVFPLTVGMGNVDERNAAVLDAWDHSQESGELENAAAKKFPPEKFARVNRVPVFTEHETDRHQWDHQKLADLVGNMNHRILDTGSFPPITEGHTPDSEAIQKGAKQPRVLGYQGNLRLGLIGNIEPKWTVFADEYHHQADAADLARMTRRSPEVWVSAKRPFYDPCAALGAETPRLDMGTISYSRSGYWTASGSDGAEVEKYSMDNAAFPGANNVALPAGNKARYEADPGAGGDDEGAALVDAVVNALSAMPEFQALQQILPLLPALQDLALKQELPEQDDEPAEAPQPGAPTAEAPSAAPEQPAAPPAAPSVAKGPQPAPAAPQSEPDGDEDVDRNMMARYMAKEISEADLKNYRDSKAAKPVPAAPTAEHYQLKAEIADLQRRKESLAAEIAEQDAKNRQATRYSRLESLRDQGYEFELADELSLTGQYNDDQFQTHCERVVTKYSRTPTGHRHFPVMDGSGLPESTAEERASQAKLTDQATKYALAEAAKGTHIDFKTALKHVMSNAATTSVK